MSAVRGPQQTPDDNGDYAVEKTIHIFEQIDSGVRPYLMESGKIIHDNDTINAAFKAVGSTSALRGRDHHYEFWRIENGSATEIDNPTLIAVLRERAAKDLDKDDRPRMSEQIKPPQTEHSQ